jgi:hypothetical protein
MDQTQTRLTTKDSALQVLGVVSKKRRKELAGQIELVTVRAGRQLVTRDTFAPTVIVGVAGAVLITTGDGHVAEVQAPFVIDSWAADDRRISNVTVVSSTPASLVLVDWRYQQSVYSKAPELTSMAAQTCAELANSKQVIDLNEASSQAQLVN